MAQLDIFRLDDRVALIAGGGGAIGGAIAEAFAGVGAKVVVAGRNQETLDATVERVQAAGSDGPGGRRRRDGRGRRRPDGRRRPRTGSAGSTSSSTPSVAGRATCSTRPRSTRATAWDWIMELNVRSTIVPTQAAVRAMIEQGHGGAVLNISSVRANLGINAGYSAYVAAKGAIASLTRQWATEWAKYGIRVNAIMPTFVDTPQVATLLADPAFKAGIIKPDPDRAGRRDARPRRPGDLPLLRRRVVRDRPGPRRSTAA